MRPCNAWGKFFFYRRISGEISESVLSLQSPISFKSTYSCVDHWKSREQSLLKANMLAVWPTYWPSKESGSLAKTNILVF
jgi:hypothetical protein